MSRTPVCECAVALRINSTALCKAAVLLERLAPDEWQRIRQEMDEHARRLRAACRCFPQPRDCNG